MTGDIVYGGAEVGLLPSHNYSARKRHMRIKFTSSEMGIGSRFITLSNGARFSYSESSILFLMYMRWVTVSCEAYVVSTVQDGACFVRCFAFVPRCIDGPFDLYCFSLHLEILHNFFWVVNLVYSCCRKYLWSV